MKITELRQKTKDELGNILLDLARERFNLRMQKGTGQLTKSDQIKKVRRTIARVKTVLKEKASA
ncbi:50S ribosomal protein L29 [Methylocucumis oryzae]|uniref:Large ribosomal subunit protein uL29 n=1 Tax=Methylocucumis oryzae TaxID=1632867 RepID=A0A0F3ILK2_9GAMM|nr:50S ribosomal protein L29 [Methylocucumis oryzae]KJV07620.1 50S ribosomal protein L29 [Methylocucumis oryzae]